MTNANAPKPPEAPKVVMCSCGHPMSGHEPRFEGCDYCDCTINGINKPAPAPEAPKVETETHGISCPKVGHGPALRGYLHAADDDGPYEVDGVWYCGRCHSWIANREYSKAQGYPRLPKPAPAPEPKQGSEEPIDLPTWDLPLAEPGISSRLSDESIEKLAYLMATETSWDHAKVNAHADELARAYRALRAELAQVREERDQYAGKLVQQVAKTATERAARERAEAGRDALFAAAEAALRERRLHGDIPDGATALRNALARAKEGEKR